MRGANGATAAYDRRAPSPPAAPQSDLTTRFAMGVAMIAVASLVTWFGGWPFRAFVALAAAVMLVEWADMHKVPRLWAWIGGLLAAAILLGGSRIFLSRSPPSEARADLR